MNKCIWLSWQKIVGEGRLSNVCFLFKVSEGLSLAFATVEVAVLRLEP